MTLSNIAMSIAMSLYKAFRLFISFIIIMLLIIIITAFLMDLSICLGPNINASSLNACFAAHKCLKRGGLWISKYDTCCFSRNSSHQPCLDLLDKDPEAFPDNIEIQIQDIRTNCQK